MTVILTADGKTWRYHPTAPPPEAGHLHAVAFAQVVDDLTLKPPRAALEVRSKTPPFIGRASADGMVGLVGATARQVPAAQLAGMPVAWTVEAAGYVTLALAGAFAAQPGYPSVWTPLDLGLRRLQRKAVTVSGRVTRVAGGVVTPVAAASVKVTAAVPVRALAGALPAPPGAASFLALSTVTGADGRFQLSLARALSVTLTASHGAASASRTLWPEYADDVLPADFRLS